MLQHVNKVLVGKNCPASYTNADALAVGDVALFDQNGAILATDAAAVSATSIKVGVAKSKVNVTLPDGSVAAKANIEYSDVITKDNKVSAIYGTYVAPVKEVITITLTSATITVGNRYVLRIIYKDIYEHPGQFSHTYEVIATATTPATLASAFAAKISKHMNRRVNVSIYAGVKASKTIGGIAFQAVSAGTAGNDITIAFAAATTAAAISVTGSAITITPKTGELTLAHIQAIIASDTDAAALITAVSGTASGSSVTATALAGGVNGTPSVITLTAMAKDDNEGVNSINEYTVVNMEASMYETEPASALNFNAPAAIVGAVITKTPGTPGKGYWKQVRDAEVRNMGYKGHVFTGAYPEVEQEKMVDPTKTYDYITVEYYNNYLSSDNQYIKHAPFTLELFVEAGELASSIVEDGIKSFIAGEDVTA